MVKRFYQPANTLKSTTWYARDAQACPERSRRGNVLSIYERPSPASAIKQTEVHIYGSSRIGIEQRNITYSTSPFAWLGSEQHRDAGTKRYVLTDHLGNVRVTVSDLLVPRPASSFGYATQDAEVIDRRDYYPFGMEMPGRRWRAATEGAARFGYNAQERDDEVAGEGNHYTALYWEYDSRLARRWNLDPKPVVGLSQYAVFELSPVSQSDPLGDTLAGTSETSARRVLAGIHDGLQSDRGKSIRNMFSLTGNKFNQIDPVAFEERARGLSDEEYGVAKGYMLLINDKSTHWVTVSKSGGVLSEKAIELIGQCGNLGLEGDYPNDGTLSQKLVSAGGINYPLKDGGSYTYLNYSNQLSATEDYSAPGLPNASLLRAPKHSELQAHELLGHALSAVVGFSKSAGYLYALQAGNMALRALGVTSFFRNDKGHGGGQGKEAEVQGLPPYLKRTP